MHCVMLTFICWLKPLQVDGTWIPSSYLSVSGAVALWYIEDRMFHACPHECPQCLAEAFLTGMTVTQVKINRTSKVNLSPHEKCQGGCQSNLLPFLHVVHQRFEGVIQTKPPLHFQINGNILGLYKNVDKNRIKSGGLLRVMSRFAWIKLQEQRSCVLKPPWHPLCY